MADGGITEFWIDEFAMRSASARVAADRAIDAHIDARERIPLLVAIDDPMRAVLLRTSRGKSRDGVDDALLAALTALGEARPPRRFVRRLALGEPADASYFRLAVTAFGRRDRGGLGGEPSGAPSGQRDPFGGGTTLLWIGVPPASPSGLMVLVGQARPAGSATAGAPTAWPLPLSADLGVRIYASAAA